MRYSGKTSAWEVKANKSVHDTFLESVAQWLHGVEGRVDLILKISGLKLVEDPNPASGASQAC